MHKTTIAVAAAFLAVGSLPIAAAAQESQQAHANNERPYSVDTTTIGTLLDDPDAAAILERLIPTVYDNDMFRTMGRPNTLRVAQQYEAAVLTEEKMQEIQAELDKLPADR
jgi:para-nitrobenzyl esterase